jgi:hypothetical protein
MEKGNKLLQRTCKAAGDLSFALYEMYDVSFLQVRIWCRKASLDYKFSRKNKKVDLEIWNEKRNTKSLRLDTVSGYGQFYSSIIDTAAVDSIHV